MLQVIRDRAQGIIVWTIVGLIVITFATFGLSSYLSGASQSVVADVNGNEITQVEFTRAYRNYQDSLRQMFGDRFDERLFPAQQIKQTVIDELVRRNLQQEFVNDNRLVASHEAVLNELQKNSVFKGEDGKFSADRYRELLSRQGISTEAYEADIAQQMTARQLAEGVEDTAFVTRHSFESLYALRDQKRDIGILSIPASAFTGQVEIKPEDIQAYYQENLNLFMQPEKIKVAYVDLNIDELAKDYEISNEAMLQYYEENIKSFTTGETEVKARHILIPVNDEQNEDVARKKIEDLRNKISSGESFEEVAKKYSQDPGSAQQGGDLGYFRRGVMDKAFEDVAFSLKPGKLSEPVRSRFGYHLIRVDSIRAPKITPFDEVRSRIKLELQRQQAEQKFYDDSQKLDNLAYENPESLEPAADALGLKIKQTDWITRNGDVKVLNSAKATAAAFSDEVLNNNRNSELIELSDTHIVVLRVKEHVAPKQKPLDSVKQQILDVLKKQKAAELAFAAADKALPVLLDAQEPKNVAESIKGASWKRVGFVSRATPPDPKTIPLDVAREAFRTSLGNSGKPGFKVVRRGNEGAVILGIFAVQKAGEAPEEIVKQQSPSIAAEIGKAQYEFLTRSLRDHASVSINLPDEDI